MDARLLDSDVLLGVLLPFGFFAAAGLVFSAFEVLRPLRSQSVRDALAIDALGLAVAWVASGAVVALVGRALAPWAGLRPSIALPPWARGALYVVVSDFFRFLTHWLMHRRAFWPLHRFHHSIRVIHWFAGNRASILHVALFMGPMAAAAWLLEVGPVAVAVNVLIMILWNHLMHTNARIAPAVQRALEWMVTTPRYHHIHHSEDARHRGVNLASVLTIWDRLWGTYVDPDGVDPMRLRFGSDDAARTPLWRNIVGI